jgi:MoxR-like ATPase
LDPASELTNNRPDPAAPQSGVPTAPPAPDWFAERFAAIAANISTVVRGKHDVVTLAVTCLVADGHLLIEDVPGVGKTSLAKALARTVQGVFGRIQFTPDLLPSDVLGTAVWNQRDAGFEFRPGPVFANVLLADEINRASPKTQSALLEAMAEEQVTVDGSTHRLQRPFMVIATQNPIEHQGTYPLPESQLDRFLMRVSMGYPARDAEYEVLTSDGGEHALGALQPIVGAQQIVEMGDYVRRIHVSDALAAYLLELAHATRNHRNLALGMSPRSLLGLQRVVRVKAAAEGRGFATPDDVKSVAAPVLAHRLIVSPEAQIQGVSAVHVLAEILDNVPVPRDTPVT